MSDAIREQVPHDARLFPLIPNTKRPTEEGAHHNAKPVDAFLELFISGNYGIALDDTFLLVDQDRSSEAVDAFLGQLPATWTQQTWKRGTHRLFRVPRGVTGHNTTWVGGELKIHGYAVGPGSVVREGALTGTYTLIDGRDPVDAPDWLLDMVHTAAGSSAGGTTAADVDMMLDGRNGGPGRDNELTAFGGFLRRRNYSETFIAGALGAIVTSGVVEQPAGREVTGDDVARIARSVSRYDPEEQDPGPISAASWVCGSDVKIVGPPVDWWLRGFFPKRELVTLYGASGVGKSSLASWLAAVVSRTGSRFLFIGVEEPFARFLGRAVLCGGDRSKIFAIEQAGRFVLPRDAELLRQQIELAGVDFVYFDSIYTHFQHIQGENVAEKTRRSLSPLMEVAHQTGATIVGVFHENKDGDYMGSTEMVNIARVTLRASRSDGQPLILSVHTTNLWEPDYGLTFRAEEQPLTDPATGMTQKEILEDGSEVDMMIRVPEMGEKTRPIEVRMSDIGGAKSDMVESIDVQP